MRGCDWVRHHSRPPRAKTNYEPTFAIGLKAASTDEAQPALPVAGLGDAVEKCVCHIAVEFFGVGGGSQPICTWGARRAGQFCAD